MKNLYNKNFKTLKKGLKETLEDRLVELRLSKWLLPKVIYIFKAIHQNSNSICPR